MNSTESLFNTTLGGTKNPIAEPNWLPNTPIDVAVAISDGPNLFFIKINKYQLILKWYS